MSPKLRAIWVGGSIAGALDILFAISFAAYGGRTPAWLLQTVATGLLGEGAYGGGWPVAILGLIGHFAMSFGWAALFVAAASRVPRLVERPVMYGLLFGTLVFFTMRLLVLPLSAFPYPVSFKPLSAGLDLLSHLFFFGLPISLAAAKNLRRSPT
ncbi:MAG TPA: hypothetical protein VFS23_39545 [Vicinamibacterales bacterium]|nr:hypothetical protein [Vicinamibacterales bacterium]